MRYPVSSVAYQVSRLRNAFACVCAALFLTTAAGAQEAQTSNGQGTFTLKVQTDIVLTNVVARDKKTGAVVKGLKASDFTVLENGRAQKIASFDYQSVDEAAVLAEKGTVTGSATDMRTVADLLNRNLAAEPSALRDHRLIVMFFDLSSMQPEDIDRAVEAAQDYIKNKMQPADSGGLGEHGDGADDGPGFYVGQDGSAAGSGAV